MPGHVDLGASPASPTGLYGCLADRGLASFTVRNTVWRWVLIAVMFIIRFDSECYQNRLPARRL
jgi:hypothetical protein